MRRPQNKFNTMAIFGSKKNKEAAVDAPKKEKVAKVAKTKVTKAKAPKVVAEKKTKTGELSTTPIAVGHGAGAILRPRITEKSGMLSQTGVYTFEVAKDATKASISRAVVSLYKVTPVKVAIINLPDRKVFIRGRRGVVPGALKALVTVKKGDKIDFV